MKAILPLFVFFFFTFPLPAETMTGVPIVLGLQAKKDSFQKIEFKDLSAPTAFELDLEKGPVSVMNSEFNGFRFTAPPGSGSADLAWYFNAPANWSNWYIIPCKGPMTTAFAGLDEVFQAYEEIDSPDHGPRLRGFQSIRAGYFQPGEDYLVWFRKTAPGKYGDLRFRIRFASPGTLWTAKLFEQALGLKALDAAGQAAFLKSRGAKILLDPGLFEKDYAEEQIASLFRSMKQSKNFPGGATLTVETAIPTLRLNPQFKTILAQAGPPDFVISSEEEEEALRNQGFKEQRKENKKTITCFYDYFGFVVPASSPEGSVLRVLAGADNHAELVPGQDGDFFSRLPKRRLTVFYRGKKEAGRIYDFLESGAAPLCLREPPPGKYRGQGEILEYSGNGQWSWTVLSPDGVTVRKASLQHHVLDGLLEEFYPDGKLRFSASYRNGWLDGDAVDYSPDGSILKKRSFKDGRAQP